MRTLAPLLFLALSSSSLAAGCAGDALSTSELASCPGWPNPDGHVVPVRLVEPYYPARAVRERIEGYVDIEAVIGRDGRVQSAEVEQSAPPGVFDQTALKAFLSWRYCPLPEGAPSYPDTVRVRLGFAL